MQEGDKEGPLTSIGKLYYDDPGCKTWHLYNWYEPYFLPFRDKDVRLLELGVHTGCSLMVWHDFFSRAEIAGLDIRPPKRVLPPRTHFYKGSQDDLALLSNMSKEIAPEGWDIIIDDASHQGSLTKTSFWHLFINHLKPGGYYFIEDWGTGYWDDWEDGKSVQNMKPEAPNHFPSHDYGMVGVIKELVDEAGMDAIRKKSTDPASRLTMFDHMVVNPGFVMVRKRL